MGRRLGHCRRYAPLVFVAGRRQRRIALEVLIPGTDSGLLDSYSWCGVVIGLAFSFLCGAEREHSCADLTCCLVGILGPRVCILCQRSPSAIKLRIGEGPSTTVQPWLSSLCTQHGGEPMEPVELALSSISGRWCRATVEGIVASLSPSQQPILLFSFG